MILWSAVACTSSAGSDSGTAPVCVDAVQASGAPSGLIACDGTFQRVAAVACEPALPTPCPVSDPDAVCSVDADCGPGGVCGSQGESCFCVRPCATDAECDAGEACVCRAVVEGSSFTSNHYAECKPAACGTAADCGGDPCGLSPGICGGTVALACIRPDDACTSQLDCAADPDGLYRCASGPAGWACSNVAFCE